MKCPKCGKKLEERTLNGLEGKFLYCNTCEEFMPRNYVESYHNEYQQRLDKVLSKFETKKLEGEETPYYYNSPIWIDYQNGKFILGLIETIEISLKTVESLLEDLENA